MKKHRLFWLLLLFLAIFMVAVPVYAYISLPSSTPRIQEKYVYRNVLETGDFLVIIEENTPYTSTPSITYSTAFVWRLMDTDGTTELAQAVGYNYHTYGYGYNVISFYLNAATFTAKAMSWEQPYYLLLSGTPVGFASPPQYLFPIEIASYSSLTETSDVKTDITAKILSLATDLDSKWGLSSEYSLLSESETGTVLSIYGQAFFRGAIYGVQSMAFEAFPIIITDVDTADRTWSTDYVTLLENQYAGTYLNPAITAGKAFFNVSYNLMGIILVLAMCMGIIFANWYVSGGNLWRGLVDASGPLIISTRLALFGLAELGLVAALCWLYISAKLWKMI